MSAVHHAAAVITDAAFEDDVDRLQECHRQVVAGVGFHDVDFPVAGGDGFTKQTVDLARRLAAAIDGKTQVGSSR